MTRRSSNQDEETLDVLGYWWLPEHTDHKVPGRFTWDAEDGGDLDLLGELIPLELKENVLPDGGVQRYRAPRTKFQNQFSIIHGEVRRQAFTLLNSFSLNGVGLHGIEESPEHVAVNAVLVGAWYADCDDIEADRAIFDIRHLTRWVNTDSFKTEFPNMNRDSQGPHIVITAYPIPSYVARLDSTEVRLTHKLELTGDQEIHSGVNHAWRLDIAAEATSELEKLTDIATDIRALVTIGTGKTADIEKVVLQHPKLVKHNLAGEARLCFATTSPTTPVGRTAAVTPHRSDAMTCTSISPDSADPT